MLPEFITTNDFFTNVIAVFLLIPIVWFLLWLMSRALKKRDKDLTDAITKGLEKISLDFKEWIKDIKDVFEKHEKSDHLHLDRIYDSIEKHNTMVERQYTKIMTSVWNTILTEQQAYNLFLEKMWTVSFWKLEFIKQLLIKNHITNRETEVKERIKAELVKQSQIYIRDFKEFTTPVWDLSDWLEENFNEEQFDEFIDQIVKIVYKEYKTQDKVLRTELKINEISTLMKKLQNNLWKKLRDDMKDKI